MTDTALVGRLDINSASAKRADTFLTFPVRGLPDKYKSFEDSSNQIHPGVVYSPEGWPLHDSVVKPWKFWLVVTPMVVSQKYENPHLFASDDGEHWTYLIGKVPEDTIINPVFEPAEFHLDSVFWFSKENIHVFYDTTHGEHDSVCVTVKTDHLSDADLFFGFDNKLYLVFRVSFVIKGVDMSALYVSSSANGLRWSAPCRITHLGRFLSPAVVTNPDSSYSLFATIQKDSVAGITNTETVYRFSTRMIDAIWHFDGPANLPDFPGYPWHIDAVRFRKDQLVLIINTKAPSVLRFALSVDGGMNWTNADKPFLTSFSDDMAWDAILYRASGYWSEENASPALGLYYSACRILKDQRQISSWHTGFTVVRFSCDSLSVQ